MTDIHTVRTQLQDINNWAPLLPKTWSSRPTRAAAPAANGARITKLSTAPLPGGMEQLIDTWPQNGAIGIHTQIGIQQALGPWADELSGMRQALTGPDPHDSTIPYLNHHLQWAIDHMTPTQWQLMTADINAVWERVQTLAHPSHITEGTCPGCGARLQWVMTDKGRINQPLCPNKCGWNMRQGLPHAQRQRLRDVNQHDPETLVTLDEAKRIWPQLKTSTIRSLVHRGQLQRAATHPTRYKLADINQAMARATNAA